MKTLFVSYAHEDTATIERLTAQLCAGKDWVVWWDRELRAGSRYTTEIQDQLNRADCVLVAWSRAALSSAWVNDEASVARERGVMVPVSLDGSVPPLGFRSFHVRQLPGAGPWSQAALAELIEDIERVLEPPPAHSETPLVTSTRSDATGVLSAVATAMVLLAASVSAAQFWNARRPPRPAEAAPLAASVATLAATPAAVLAAGPAPAPTAPSVDPSPSPPAPAVPPASPRPEKRPAPARPASSPSVDPERLPLGPELKLARQKRRACELDSETPIAQAACIRIHDEQIERLERQQKALLSPAR